MLVYSATISSWFVQGITFLDKVTTGGEDLDGWDHTSSTLTEISIQGTQEIMVIK